MADLFDRLFVVDDATQIPVHLFHAAITDYAGGETTRTQMIAFFALDSEAQSDLTTLCDAIDALSVAEKVRFAVELHAVSLMAEAGAKYTAKSAFKTRLGL